MNTTNNTNLPSRLKESSFRQYETVIDSAVRSFPDVIVIPEKSGTSTLNLNTFSARLRDAMASLILYRWTSEIIDMDRFDEVYSRIKVSHVMPDRVIVGDTEHIKLYYKQQNLPSSQLESFTSHHPSVSESTPRPTSVISATSSGNNAPMNIPLSQDVHSRSVELKLLAGLAALRLLNTPVEIEIDSEQAEYLEANFDVVVTKSTTNEKCYILQ